MSVRNDRIFNNHVLDYSHRIAVIHSEKAKLDVNNFSEGGCSPVIICKFPEIFNSSYTCNDGHD